MANLGITGLLVCNLVTYPWILLTERIFLAHNNFIRANVTNAGFGTLRAPHGPGGLHRLRRGHVVDLGPLELRGLLRRIDRLCLRNLPLWIPSSRNPARGNSCWSDFWGVRISVCVARQRRRTGVERNRAGGGYRYVRLAGRVVGIAVVTGASLDRIVYSRLVVAGKRGPAATFELAQRHAVYIAGLTGATALGLYLLAQPLLPLVFGSSFGDAIGILKILCWILPLVGLQNIAFDALNAANLHRFQVNISAVTVLFGAAMVAILTHFFSVDGTLLGVYISEISLAIALWAGLAMISRALRTRLPA